MAYHRMRFVSLDLAGTLQGLVAKFTVFQISKSYLFLMISFLTEVIKKFSRITQFKLCEALGSGGTMLFLRD